MTSTTPLTSRHARVPFLRTIPLRLRGSLDGRQGRPASVEGIVATATLHRLQTTFADAADAPLHTRLSEMRGNLELIAGISGPGGELGRAEGELGRADERLAEAQRRLELALSAGVEDAVRLGEQELPIALITARRAREFRARVRHARHRVEDEKTAAADHRTTLARAHQRVESDRAAAASEVLGLHAQASASAATYLPAAERHHPSPVALGAAAAELLPRLPGWASARNVKETS